MNFWFGMYLGGYIVSLLKLKDDKELSIASAAVVLLWPLGLVVVTIQSLVTLSVNLNSKF